VEESWDFRAIGTRTASHAPTITRRISPLPTGPDGSEPSAEGGGR
jgi:hypothetical protein